MNQTFKRILGLLVVLSPVLVLIVWWLSLVPVTERFVDPQTTLLSIGRITGLVGLALYALSLVLHVRVTPLKMFLDGPYICKLHHDLGSWALVFLLIHPIALALRFATIDLYVAAKFLVPTDNLVNMAGLLALFIMAAAMVVTYYYKKNHTLWLWIHRSMLVAYLGSFIHLIFVSSDTSNTPAIKYYLIFLMLVGILAFIYQRLSKRSSTAETKSEACEK